jgi:hypothetical protein
VRSSVIVSFIAEIYHLNSGLQVADLEEITIFFTKRTCTTGTQPCNDR